MSTLKLAHAKGENIRNRILMFFHELCFLDWMWIIKYIMLSFIIQYRSQDFFIQSFIFSKWFVMVVVGAEPVLVKLSARWENSPTASYNSV